jgi:hypothetical protein
MYCSNCGHLAEGNYCSGCGAKLAVVPTCANWRQEVRYDVLLRLPHIRDLVGRHVAQARPGLTGEQFIELCDKLLSPLTVVPIGAVTGLALPLYERLGIRTGKSRAEVLCRPIGEAIVAALCSLARQGQKVKSVEQSDDGCLLVAEIRSDVRTMTGGELRIVLRRQEQETLVEAATNIAGQLFDWGKSVQVLAQLFEDVRRFPDAEPVLAEVA